VCPDLGQWPDNYDSTRPAFRKHVVQRGNNRLRAFWMMTIGNVPVTINATRALPHPDTQSLVENCPDIF